MKNGNDVLVSIVMPAYNAASYIEDALQSVFSQSYTCWELIVIDDCSGDETPELLRKAEHAFLSRKKQSIPPMSSADALKGIRAFPEIRILRNTKNMGVSYSRNRGILEASGDYIAFLDSDDLWAGDKLEKQLALIKKKEREGQSPSLVFTGSAFIKGGTPLEYTLSVPEIMDYKTLLKQNLISCSSVLIHRELLLKYPMPESGLPFHEDFALWLVILRNEGNAFGINLPLITYRVSAASKSGNKLMAAKMNWNTYKYAGIPLGSRLYYMLQYSIRSILKWIRISRA